MSPNRPPSRRTKRSETSVLDHLTETKEYIEAAGLEVTGLSTFVKVWKKLGVRGLLFVILFVGFPTGQYSALRYAVHSGLPRTIGGFGLRFEAEDWSLSLLKMQATARNVRVSGPSAERPVLTAAEVAFHGSAWTLLRGLPDMLTFHMFGGAQPFNQIVVRHGELHLERSLTGHLNWTDFVDAVPRERFEEALDGIYRINELTLDDFRISYTEQLPGGSSDGIVRTAHAEVTLDQIAGTLSDLEPPEEWGARPTRFKFNGRSAAGVFEVAGSAALFAPEGSPRDGDSTVARVSLDSKPAQPAYPFELSVYLENIAAAAYGQMVPISTIVPINGIINGRTTIVRNDADAQCSGGFTMREVRFAPNPLVVTDPRDLEVVRQLVANVVYSGPFELCDPSNIPGSNRSTPSMPGDRPAAFALARLNAQATAAASPGVKALVERDRRIIAGEPVEASLGSLTTSLAQQMGLRLAGSLAGEKGRAAAESLVAGDDRRAESASGGKNPGQAVLGGMKSVGSGIKRLFGGGKSNRK